MLELRIGLVAACLLAAWPNGAAARDAGKQPESCRAIKDDVQRLACYDRAFAVDSPPTTSTTTIVPAHNQPPASGVHEKNQAATFGQTAAQRQAAFGDPSPPPELANIAAVVSDVGRQPGGDFIVTLDNGQVWRQIEHDSRAWPEKGDAVTIRRGALGSFLLITPSHLATRVRRIR